MCDSFVALGDSTVRGSVLLAKSADTEVNEAEHVVRFGARDYPHGALVRITHLNIPQARRTHEIILGKSFWSWGAELGCNEHGVAVGNEAAFSNQSEEKDGVVVLDLLRLAVERARNAREAVDVIGHHIETYGQGGNCQMMGNYAFDSGLLVADRNEAYVVNGAGRHWAARRVSGVEAISNRYQVRDDWDLSSLEPENGAKPDFRALFAEEALEASCGASERENAAQRILEERRGAITLKDMADILRHVGDEDAYEVCYEGGPDRSRGNTRESRRFGDCLATGPAPAGAAKQGDRHEIDALHRGLGRGRHAYACLVRWRRWIANHVRAASTPRSRGSGSGSRSYARGSWKRRRNRPDAGR